ncbi:MAG: hypothetical protein JW867_02100 [Candidatus Omnitrophica bacterium]|nr:hypothetical protein [Candidatus Omnitrophota bacterium]
MGLYAELNKKVKKLSFFDLKLIQIVTVCFVILVIKFAPRIIVIKKEWFITIFLLSIIKPLYVFFFKKEKD